MVLSLIRATVMVQAGCNLGQGSTDTDRWVGHSLRLWWHCAAPTPAYAPSRTAPPTVAPPILRGRIVGRPNKGKPWSLAAPSCSAPRHSARSHPGGRRHGCPPLPPMRRCRGCRSRSPSSTICGAFPISAPRPRPMPFSGRAMWSRATACSRSTSRIAARWGRWPRCSAGTSPPMTRPRDCSTIAAISTQSWRAFRARCSTACAAISPVSTRASRRWSATGRCCRSNTVFWASCRCAGTCATSCWRGAAASGMSTTKSAARSWRR